MKKNKIRFARVFVAILLISLLSAVFFYRMYLYRVDHYNSLIFPTVDNASISFRNGSYDDILNIEPGGKFHGIFVVKNHRDMDIGVALEVTKLVRLVGETLKTDKSFDFSGKDDGLFVLDSNLISVSPLNVSFPGYTFNIPKDLPDGWYSVSVTAKALGDANLKVYRGGAYFETANAINLIFKVGGSLNENVIFDLSQQAEILSISDLRLYLSYYLSGLFGFFSLYLLIISFKKQY